MTYRPGGVTALAVIFLILAVFGAIGAVLIPLSSTMAPVGSVNVETLFMTMINMGLTPTEQNIMMMFTIALASSSQTYAGYLILGAIGAAIYTVISVITGVGLLKMKKWGYYLALIIGILMIIGGIIGLLVIVGIIPLIFGIVIVVYLSGDVKHEFE